MNVYSIALVFWENYRKLLYLVPLIVVKSVMITESNFIPKAHGLVIAFVIFFHNTICGVECRLLILKALLFNMAPNNQITCVNLEEPKTSA